MVLGVAHTSVHMGDFPFLGGEAADTEDALVHGGDRTPDKHLKVLLLGNLGWKSSSAEETGTDILIHLGK